MNKQQLASRIWASANKMRSKIEANEYKDYILGFIFYKFLCDAELRLLRESGWDDDSMREYLSADNPDPDTVEQCRNSLGYFIPYPDLYTTWTAPGADFTVGDVRDALNRFARNISPHHRKVYQGIFDTLQAGLGKLGESAGSQTKAIHNLLGLISDIPTDGSEDYDVLGFIYEYLISNFAANAGKKAGEFYTPHEVALMMSEIVAHHLRGRDSITIYDPTSGSGSLLLNIGRSVGRHTDPRSITYYAQELKEATYNLTRMNLVMRGILPDNINVRNGDTLEEDWPMFDDSDPSSTYETLYCDAVVSNPPYSQEWTPGEQASSDPRYSAYGVAPKGTADYAFLLHDLYHVKPDGVMTIVLPHGVLFRGGSEEQIRRNLIERNKIDAVIGLPPNIFFGTGIPTIVMVLRQNRPEEDVLFIDASKGFEKEGKNNRLRARDIRRIVDAVAERREVPGFSRRVSRDLIRANDYNLNIPRYVSSADAGEEWNLYATMFGGIPDRELASLAPVWEAFPALRPALLRPVAEGYSELIPSAEELAGVIRGDDHVVRYMLGYADEVVQPLADWLDGEVIERLADPEFVASLNPDALFAHASDLLFASIRPYTLVDEYAAYQALTDHWAEIAADLETLRTEGLDAARAVDPRMVVKKKEGKDVEVQDGWQGRIIPIPLVERLLLTDDLRAVEKLEHSLDDVSGRIAEILESLSSLPESEGATPWLKEDGTAFVPKALSDKVKAIKKEYGKKALETLPEESFERLLVEADKALAEEKKLKAEVKETNAALEAKAIETIKGLSDEEILFLLPSKWVYPLKYALLQVSEAVTADVATRLKTLSAKYSETLVDIDRTIADSERTLATLIDDLTGSEADMAGLHEFQKLLRHE